MQDIILPASDEVGATDRPQCGCLPITCCHGWMRRWALSGARSSACQPSATVTDGCVQELSDSEDGPSNHLVEGKEPEATQVLFSPMPPALSRSPAFSGLHPFIPSLEMQLPIWWSRRRAGRSLWRRCRRGAA